MNTHTSLNQHAKGVLLSCTLERLRGVIATWEENSDSLNLSYYFDGEPSEEEIEEATVLSTEILAGLPVANLSERFISLKLPNPLPESQFWVYKKRNEA